MVKTEKHGYVKEVFHFGSEEESNVSLKEALIGVPWWLSRLRIWHHHCCGSSYDPWPRNFFMLWAQLKKIK